MPAKLISMERSKEEREEAKKRIDTMPADGPDYPWGLCLNLGREELEKLGVKNLPAIGAEVKIQAVAKVVRVSQSASERGDESKGVELQITELGLDLPKDAGTTFAEKASKLYKSGD